MAADGGWAWRVFERPRAHAGYPGAASVAVPGWSDEGWLLPDDARAWQAFEPSGEGAVALLPFRDPFIARRVGPAGLTGNPDAKVLRNRTTPTRIGDVSVLYHHAIVCGGELVGLWDYDPKRRAVITKVWKPNRTLASRIAKAADATGQFIREELGDARLSAVDPPSDRARRLAFLRRAGHTGQRTSEQP
jgi:hypothetical protein